MESKNIKVIDEHGIDRVANVICSIDVDGSDYVIYWIERDNENDNLFISKLIKNNDGTSNMINIDDALEKSKLNDIVKEMITNAINDESDKVSSNKITVNSGKTINISSALFNKEQNINVQKTYITTVKKSVIKVSEDYYRVDTTGNDFTEVKSEQIFVESEKQDSLENNGVVEPVVEQTSNDDAKEVLPSDNATVEPIPVPVIPEVSVPEVPSANPMELNLNDKVNVDPKINIIGADASLPVEPVMPVQSEPMVSVDSINTTQPEPVVSADSINNVQPEPVASVDSNATVQPEPAISVDSNANVQPQQDKLFFDGSKETNLSDVLNEVATEPSIAVDTVEPIREFGQDQPMLSEKDDSNVVEDNSGNSSGFASNKFFIVIAIAFFLAACVFLGYEVFKYFQL